MAARFRLLCCFVTLLPWSAAQTNSFDTPQGREQGSALFQARCAYCHGSHGEGGRGPDLTTGRYRHGGSDAALYSTIRKGVPGTEMVSVGLTDEEAWKVVAFVKRLGSPGLGEKAAGDPAAGKAVYESKGRCASCHSIGRVGGSLGPDLDDVGRRRDLKYLMESLLEPDADVPPSYRAIGVVTKSGEAIAGIRLNEDDLSIQLRDANENLLSFLKQDVREIRRDTRSLMPAYGAVLSKKELEDLVAYLSGLRGEQ